MVSRYPCCISQRVCQCLIVMQVFSSQSVVQGTFVRPCVDISVQDWIRYPQLIHCPGHHSVKPSIKMFRSTDQDKGKFHKFDLPGHTQNSTTKICLTRNTSDALFVDKTEETMHLQYWHESLLQYLMKSTEDLWRCWIVHCITNIMLYCKRMNRWTPSNLCTSSRTLEPRLLRRSAKVWAAALI